MVKVDVKWQREVFKGVEIDTSLPPSVFKTQLFSLSGVPPERQKIMGLKGGLLKDDADWVAAGLKEGQKITMMGTADKIPEAPKEPTAFLEDLPHEEQDTTGLAKYGAGLENMGNTCFMNSTIQCLYSIRELRDSIATSAGVGSNASLVTATRLLFSKLTRSGIPITPLEFLFTLRSKFPQFSQQTPEGYFMQQDAEECWSSIVFGLRESMQTTGAPAGSADSEIRKLLEIKLRSHLKCEESGETIEDSTTAYMLKCNITADVNVLSEGLRLGLKDDSERTSAALGRVAPFVGSSRLTAAPRYLTVQMVRFFYKADVKQKAKILRRVAFPATLDAFEFFEPDVQKQLAPARAREAVMLDAKQGLGTKAGAAKNGSTAEGEAATEDGCGKDIAVAAGPAAPSAGAKTDGVPLAMETDAAAAGPLSSTAAQPGEKRSREEEGEATGRYELVGVLTHKGRSADSGHYVAWIKQDDGAWVLFDDDKLEVKKEDEVLSLAGGGDWHMAYMLLYRSIDVPRD